SAAKRHPQCLLNLAFGDRSLLIGGIGLRFRGRFRTHACASNREKQPGLCYVRRTSARNFFCRALASPKWVLYYSFTIRGPRFGYSSSTSTTTSRIANSSCVACDEVVTLCKTTLPVSMSSASLRNAATALPSFSPNACLPARSAHSAAWIVVLPPL